MHMEGDRPSDGSRIGAAYANGGGSGGITAVRLVGGRELLLVPKLSPEEVAACLGALHGDVEVVALRETSSRVVVPLSLLVRAPWRFASGEYEVVVTTEDAGRRRDGAEARLTTASPTPHAALSPTSARKKRRSKHHRTRRHHHGRSQAIGLPEFVDAYYLLPSNGRLAAETEDDDENGGALVTDGEVTGSASRRVSDTLAQQGDDDRGESEDEEEEELLRELDLTDFELPQLVHVFTQACPRGDIDRVIFDDCLEKILSQSGRYDPLARKMFERLFTIFDADNEGVVDVTEFLGGVSVFASGERDDKIRCIFDLYDSDHDGLISLEEMTKYLTAVFIVIAETSPELFQQKNIDPMELGAITAKQCFQEARVETDGRLSFAAFQEWYLKPGPTQLASAVGSTNDVKARRRKSNTPSGAGKTVDDELSLVRLQELTGLSGVTADDLFSLFSSAAVDADNGRDSMTATALTRDAFKSCFFAILQKQKRKPTRALARFLDRLFNAFDKDGSDTVDFVELSSGLSILCGGTRDDKVIAAFSLFDADGDGFITREEMEKYLASVFHIVYESQPEMKAALGITATQLATYTTAQAFQEADVNHDDKLSLEEFRKWYSLGAGAVMQPHIEARNQHTQVSFSSISHQALASIDEVAAATGLSGKSPSEVFELLASKVNDDGVLSRNAVHETFDQLLVDKRQLGHSRLHNFVDVLFNSFDTDADGFVDFCELASGISVCCDGTQHDKVQAAFTLFDVNQDGYISQDDMETYLSSVFRMLFTVSPVVNKAISPEQLAVVTTADAFATYDTDFDGRLSLVEFTSWYSSATTVSTRRDSTKILPASSRRVLKEMQGLTNLGSYDVNDILEFFEASADAQGNVSKSAFFRSFGKLLATDEKKDVKSATEEKMTQKLLNELFELFDTDGNGMIDVQELGAGLSILCGGKLADKTRSLFTLYDVNHDGFISPDEMQSYLTAVFKVLYKATPQLYVSTGGLSPSQLAFATTKECFQSFDKNHDHQLSFEEFKEWIDKQKGPAESVKSGQSLQPRSSGLSSSSSTSRVRNDAVIPVDAAKKLTGLHTMSLEKVAQIFSSAANPNGQITRDSFDRCFYQYVCADATSQLTAEESKRVHEVIDRLFTAFDADQNGLVDYNDLSSGLSILCGGSRDAKVQAAFDLYDANGDGLISEEEMVHYLSSVFKLLYALDPTRQASLGGISADDLAVITAAEIFADADTDKDGKLNLEEFKAWYAQPQQESFNMVIAPLDLEEVRKLTNLGSMDVVDVFERFAERADEDGTLERKSFDQCFLDIIETASHPRSEAEKLRAKVVADRLFDIFDRDHNGRIDFSELASGLSVLCKGARDAKVKAAFRLYDFNGDGFISLDEMTRYLTSIFKVLYEVQPQMQKETGVSAEELGSITAEQAFLEADRNRDGKLSYDEFLTWYNSPSQAGISSSVAKNAIVDSSLKWMPLNEVKTLTNLASFEPEEVFEVFAAEANNDGLLSRAAFHSSFKKLMKSGESDSKREHVHFADVINGLFDLFDSDSSGYVDFGELASGLSVLCGGTQQQKVRAAFSLFDFNGDGFISLEEMTRYLTSVFKVLYQVSPAENMENLAGVTPEELGEVTAQQAFAEADQDHDGRLTFDEFQQWYQRPGGIGEVAKDGEQLFSLAEARRLTSNLQAFSPIEVFEALAGSADEHGYVSKHAFDDCFRNILTRGHPGEGMNSSEYERITAILNRLFELFDVDKNGKVDFSEISSGLSVFCGGTSDEKVKAAFSLYDYNGDGFITLDEMSRYLTAVFKVLQEASPRDDALSKESPEELGERTANQAFGEADIDQDGKLSFEEFRRWYTSSNTANIERLIENNIPEWLSLQEVRRLTNLGAYTPGEVMETFASCASASEGTLNKDAFRRALAELQHASPNGNDDAAKDRLRVLVDRIFALFDTDRNGVVDFSELASGLSVLCGGSETDKARAAFNLYDVNHDGYISLGEMRLYLTSVFKVLYEVNPETQSQMGGVSPDDLANITAEQAFAEVDTDKDGRLSFEEFRRWYLQPSPSPSSAVATSTPAHVPDWVSLQTVKQMTHLEKYAPNEVFEVFANRCADDGTISREAFEDCFEQLIDARYKTDEPHLARVRLILDRLFTIFDTDGSGVVDFCELSSGLSVLCGGTREDKVRSAFALYDLNQDGYISFEEMVRYLTSVFKVLYEANPATREKLGVEPHELATITAEQCFVEADLNHDGRLSFEEFVGWYSRTQELAETPSAGVASLVSQQRSLLGKSEDSNGSEDGISLPMPTELESFPTSKLFSASNSDGTPIPLSPTAVSGFNLNSSNMEHARHLLKLDSYEVNDVFEIFAEAAPSGELNFANFKKCFDQIIKLAGGHETTEDKEEADQMIRRLFRVFDTDKSNTIDFGELASGLSVLSGSSMDDKVRAAFQLYDINGDGFISQEEMISYMTSIFKVMYETSDSAKNKMNVSPEELARVTATQCFKEADLNNDGKLSFEEFKKWCTSAV